jgi:MFS family permease
MTASTVAAVPAALPVPADSERRRWIMLAVLVAGQFMALLDVTIVNVAMPTIAADLHASGAALQLVVSGYTVAYAMLLVTGARLGNLRGTRGMFLAGVATFTLASLACGLAPSTGALIGARFVQGAGAAAMVPQVFTVIQRRFSGAARARALSVYAAVLATAAVAGQVLGGVLVSANLLGAGWRPVFLVNVPVGLAIAVLVPLLVPVDRPGGRRLDLAGLVTGSAAVLLVVLPLVLGRQERWPAWTRLCLIAGVLLVGVFGWVERSVAARGGDPLLDLRVFRAPGMTAGVLALAAGMIGFGGFLFSLTLYLQQGLGDSPLRAGLTFAPAAAVFGATGYWWRRLPASVHHRLVPVGFLVAGLVYALLSAGLRLDPGGGAWFAALLLASGAGYGLAYSPLITQALVRVPVRSAPDASGVLTTTIQLSQVVGVAVFGSVFLSLAAHPRPHAAGTALSTVYILLAALTLAGAAGGMVLARTVRAAAG